MGAGLSTACEKDVGGMWWKLWKTYGLSQRGLSLG